MCIYIHVSTYFIIILMIDDLRRREVIYGSIKVD